MLADSTARRVGLGDPWDGNIELEIPVEALDAVGLGKEDMERIELEAIEGFDGIVHAFL